MGWLDANEYFFMELVARDRAADIASPIDPAPEGADGTPLSPWSRTTGGGGNARDHPVPPAGRPPEISQAPRPADEAPPGSGTPRQHRGGTATGHGSTPDS